jgi:hypothetical protein
MTLMLSKFKRLSHLAAFFFELFGLVGSNPLKPHQEAFQVRLAPTVNLMFVGFEPH